MFIESLTYAQLTPGAFGDRRVTEIDAALIEVFRCYLNHDTATARHAGRFVSLPVQGRAGEAE